MQIDSLRLRTFRNYEEEAFTFSPECNLITGDNAQGKTNLLEALYLLITGRAFRAHHLADLIKTGSESFFLEAHFEKHTLPQTLSIGVLGTEKRILHNGTPLPSPSHLLGLLQGVLLSPEDRALIAGSPGLRRRYLDLHIAQLDPPYVRASARYTRALKHRNTLLRGRHKTTLEAWEAQLAQEGAYITKARSRAVQELAKPLQAIHERLSSGRDQLTLTYKPTLTEEAEENQKRYRAARVRELIVGHTLVGPHRDDLLISIGGEEVRQFGSEGQKMSCVCSLKLAEWERLKARSDETPLLLIDDLGLGLDEKRRRALQEIIEEKGQVFVTSPRVLSFGRETQHYTIKEGAQLTPL